MSATTKRQPRERSVPCKHCGYKTFDLDRVCAFCKPDPHEAWAAVDDAMTEDPQ